MSYLKSNKFLLGGNGMSDLLKKYRAYYKREISTEEFEQCNTLAYREYFRSTQIAEKCNESNMILFDLYHNGYHDIVDCVRELGFKSFYIVQPNCCD